MNREEVRSKLYTILEDMSLDTPEDIEYVVDVLVNAGVTFCDGMACPECGAPLTHEWSEDYKILPPLSTVPETIHENVYHCASCGSAWKATGNRPLERYFFG